MNIIELKKLLKQVDKVAIMVAKEPEIFYEGTTPIDMKYEEEREFLASVDVEETPTIKLVRFFFSNEYTPLDTDDILGEIEDCDDTDILFIEDYDYKNQIRYIEAADIVDDTLILE